MICRHLHGLLELDAGLADCLGEGRDATPLGVAAGAGQPLPQVAQKRQTITVMTFVIGWAAIVHRNP
jgi:hypothetical protein